MISTTCTGCTSRIRVPVVDARVVRDQDAELLVLHCEDCGRLVLKRLPPRLARAVLRLGAATVPTPLRPPHPERVEDPFAPAFTTADVLRLRRVLAGRLTPADLPGLGAADSRE